LVEVADQCNESTERS